MDKDIGKHKWPDWLPAVCMSLLLLGCVWTVLGNYDSAYRYAGLHQ